MSCSASLHLFEGTLSAGQMQYIVRTFSLRSADTQRCISALFDQYTFLKVFCLAFPTALLLSLDFCLPEESLTTMKIHKSILILTQNWI